jgi:class 3 adenylate cyclase/tetratricopeptide (TPR) repeat protein
MDERRNLELVMAQLESQRATLGDAAVEAALVALKEKLAALEARDRETQRKYATVLFADLKGFTAMSESMDPEEVRDVLNEIWHRIDAAILQHGGTIDKHIGDGIMALFGVPTARPDDPERAVSAAFAMHAALRAIVAHRPGGHPLAMRVGVHTGVIVWGRVGTTGERTAMGDAVNLASRLEGAAPPGGILVSHETMLHVRRRFAVHPAETLSLKGKAEPVAAYRVEGLRARDAPAPHFGFSGAQPPLLGRDRDLRRLHAAFQAVATSGRARLVGLVGEAGVGKTRLSWAFTDGLTDGGHGVDLLRGQCEREHQQSPYGLLRDVIFSLAEIDPSDAAAVQRRKLADGIEAFHAPAALLPFIGHLVGLDMEDDPVIRSHLDAPERLKQVAEDAVVRLFQQAASRRPVVLVLEDVHWADAASVDLFDRVRSQCAPWPLLILATGRPAAAEVAPAWFEPGADHRDVWVLDELSLEAGVALARRILAGRADVDEDVSVQIAESTGGNPYFLEETARWYLEREPGEGALGVPGTVRTVLQARMDILPYEERLVLQQAAILGQSFGVAALAFVSGMEADDVESAAARLVERGLLQPGTTGGGGQGFAFRHALLWETAYDTVPKAHRRAWHGRAADWWRDADRGDERRALGVARHLERAGRTREAAEWYVRAAADSYRTGAMREADVLSSRSLALTEPLEIDEASVGLRRRALRTRVDVLLAVGTGEEVREAVDVLEQVCAGDPWWEATALLRRSASERQRGEDRRMEDSLARAERLARASGDPALCVAVAIAQAKLTLLQRRLEAGVEICEAALREPGLARSDRAILELSRGRHLLRLGRFHESMAALESARDHAEATGDAVCAMDARASICAILRQLDRLDEARRGLEAIGEEARRTGHRHLESHCLNDAAECYRLTGNLDEARRLYRASIDIKRSLGHDHTPMTLNLALCEILAGDAAEARRLLDGMIPQPALRPGWLAATLACEAEAGALHLVDDLLVELTGTLSENPVVDLDLAWPAEHAGDRLAARGEAERSRSAYALALDQWRALGREDEAAQVAERMDLLAGSEPPG